MCAEGLIPPSIWEHISHEEYIIFRIYCLEFISLGLEQISWEQEQEHLKALGDTLEYGVLQQLCVLRDVGAMTLVAFYTNKDVIGKITALMSDNYPEILFKAHVINAPWVFSTIFAFISLFLAQKTVAKVAVLSTNYLEVICSEVDVELIPDFIPGGVKSEYNVPFAFNNSPGGPLSLLDPMSLVEIKAAVEEVAEKVVQSDIPVPPSKTSVTPPPPGEA